MATVIGPKNTCQEAEQFAEPTGMIALKRGPEENDYAGEGERCGGIAFHARPVFSREPFPKQRPDGRRAEIKSDVRRGGIAKRPVKGNDVGGEAEATAEPKAGAN